MKQHKDDSRLFSEIRQLRIKLGGVFKVLKGKKKSQCKILHPAKIFFKNKDKINSFIDITEAERIYHREVYSKKC